MPDKFIDHNSETRLKDQVNGSKNTASTNSKTRSFINPMKFFCRPGGVPVHVNDLIQNSSPSTASPESKHECPRSKANQLQQMHPLPSKSSSDSHKSRTNSSVQNPDHHADRVNNNSNDNNQNLCKIKTEQLASHSQPIHVPKNPISNAIDSSNKSTVPENTTTTANHDSRDHLEGQDKSNVPRRRSLPRSKSFERLHSSATLTTAPVQKQTSRRVIFPTLYESPCQASPLCKNQKRDFVLQSSGSFTTRTLSTNTSASSVSSLKVTNAQVTTEMKQDEGNENVSSLGSIVCEGKNASSNVDENVVTQNEVEGSTPTLPSKDLCYVGSAPVSLLAHNEADGGTPTLPSKGLSDDESAPVSSSSSEKALDSHSTVSNINSATAVNDDASNGRRTPTMPMPISTSIFPKRSKSSPLLPVAQLNPDPNQSPTSIVMDLHKKVMPGPSILRKKGFGLPNLTHPDRSSVSTSSPSPPLGNNLDALNKTIQTVTTEARLMTNKWIPKSMSDSCIESLEALTISNDWPKQTSSSPFTEVHPPPRLPPRGSVPKSSAFFTRHISHEEMKLNKRRIRFDPRVWVHVIHRPKLETVWYTESDMRQFKYEAVLRIREWNRQHICPRRFSTEMIPTGTGRIISTHGDTKQSASQSRRSNVLFTNPALALDAEEVEEQLKQPVDLKKKRGEAVLKEIKSILLVDCYDIFLSLLAKDITAMMPHVKISTAKTAEEALKMIGSKKEQRDNKCTHGFDMIIVEHRLRRGISGANLIRHIAVETNDLANEAKGKNECTNRYPLVIGMTAYFKQDEKLLKASGSDLVWGKPPPKMTGAYRDQLLLRTMRKRNRKDFEDLCG